MTMSCTVPSLPSQKPCTSAKTGMYSILDAAYGLTSLGSPNMGSEQPPRPSNGNTSNTPLVRHASETRRVTQDRDVHKPILVGSATLKEVPSTKQTLKPITEMSLPPSAHYHPNVSSALPPASRSFLLENPSPWPPMIQPHQPAPGFESLRYSDAAIALDNHYSIGQRIAMAKLATSGQAIARYPYIYPPPSYQLKAPASGPFQSILDPSWEDQSSFGPSTKNFPELLLEVLSAEENTHIISWLPHGRGFIIHDKQRFVGTILPRYFDGAKFTSFTRRLKRWNFVRVPRGPELGAYSHKKFQRDQPDLVQQMSYQAEKSRFSETGKKENKQLSCAKEEKEGNVNCEDDMKNGITKYEAENEKLKERVKNKVEAKFQESLLRNEGQALIHESLRPTSQEKDFGGMPNTKAHLHANVVSPVDIQGEVMLARSVLAHQIASGGLANGTLVPSVNLSRYAVGSSMPGYAPTVPLTDSQRMIDIELAERTKRIIGAERMLGLSSGHYQQPDIRGNGPGKELAPGIPASHKAHHDVMDRVMNNFSSSLAPPFIHQADILSPKSSPMRSGSKGLGDTSPTKSNGEVAATGPSTNVSDTRVIMMTREEEEGFAEYMSMKKSSGVSAAL